MAWTSVTFDCWAYVGSTMLPVTQAIVSYEMNKIPTCTLVLPVGYKAVSPGVLSPIHGTLLDVPFQLPITVWAEFSRAAGVTASAVPEGTFCLFEGWITGVGYRRTYNGYALTLDAIHWLAALNFSSVLNTRANPMNPAHFTLSPLVGMEVARNHLLLRTAATAFVTAENVQLGLWRRCIAPWLSAMLNTAIISSPEFQQKGGNPGNDSIDDDAAAAFGRIDGMSLPLRNHGQDWQMAAAAIADDLAGISGTPVAETNTLVSMAKTTIWDKIVGDLAPRYMFSLIPYPQRAKIIPFIPGLRAEWNPSQLEHTILTQDISLQDMSVHMPRPIRAFGLFAGHGNIAGANLRFTDSGDDTIGGMYVGQSAGTVILRKAPRWLSQYLIPSLYSGFALGIHDITGVRGNAFNNPNVGQQAGVKTPEECREDQKILLDELAHALYVNELLRDRRGDIQGPVRMDISPGSTIGIQGLEYGGAAGTHYATVIRVIHSLDAQSAQCYTAFHLAHIRTEEEHGDDRYTVNRHPLYDEIFVGDQFI